jgi:hypothetical protein
MGGESSCLQLHPRWAGLRLDCGWLSGGTVEKPAFSNGERSVEPLKEIIMRKIGLVIVAVFVTAGSAMAQDAGACRGYTGPGGPCYSGPGGGLYSGPGGGAYSGPGGGLYSGPGGGMYSGPDGGMYSGPGGGLYTGPGGGSYSGPGGGAYDGPRDGSSGYRGPWSPCVTGAAGADWTRQNCP